MRNHIAGVAAIISLLSGCASNSLRYASTDVPPIPAGEREATAIFVDSGTCASPRAPDAAGGLVGAALIGIGVDFAVSAASALLKRQRDGRNAVWAASAEASGIHPRPAPRTFCLTLVRGVLADATAVDARGASHPTFRGEPAFLFKVDLTLDALTAPAPRPGAHPAGAGEAAAGADEGPAGAALHATPYELRYAETSAPVRGSGRKDVSVVLAFSPQTLEATAGAAGVPDTAKAAVLRFNLGRLDVGRVYDKRLLGSSTAVTSLPRSAQTMVTAVVAESEGSSIALDALISAFDGNKDDLSKALKSTIQDAVSGGAKK
ncbi:MAG TPA: hypothetical protein VGC56_10570 [Allosphingosinicella sp.]|jgi:hypothetical protein